MTYVDQKNQKIISQKSAKPSSFPNMVSTNSVDNMVYLTWIYSWTQKDYIWSTTGYDRIENNVIWSYVRTAKSSLSFSLTLDREIKRVVSNGINSLRSSQVNVTQIPSNNSLCTQRVGINSAWTKGFTCYAGTAAWSWLIVHSATTLQMIGFIPSPSPTAALYGTNEIALWAWTNFSIRNDTTFLQLGATITVAANILRISQDANYYYLMTSTLLYRVDKITRLLVVPNIGHWVSWPVDNIVVGTKLYIRWSTQVWIVDLTARANLPIIAWVSSWNIWGFLVYTGVKLLVVVWRNLNVIREINLTTNLLEPWTTDIFDVPRFAVVQGGRLHIGHSVWVAVYSTTMDANNKFPFLYNTQFGHSNAIIISAFASADRYPDVSGNFMYFNDNVKTVMVDLNPAVLTINGVSEQRQTFVPPAWTTTLNVVYQGTVASERYPNINLILEV